MIKAVIFDIGGVVILPRYEKLYKYLSSGLRIFLNPFVGEGNRLRKYIDLYKHTRKLNEDVLAIVKKLKAAGYVTAALSNVSTEKSKAYEAFNLNNYFHPLLTSAELGVKKPDRRIYEMALEKIGMSAEECVFVDNESENLPPAAAMGMKTVLFKSANQLERDLGKFGIKLGI